MDDQPFDVRTERNVLIPLSDNVSLAGDLYLPDTAGPSPALVSYYPYHKDDLIGGLFEHARRYFAGHGYASLLVDYRGTGSSEGICTENFDTDREAADGAEVIVWAASQAWCTGNVGFWGMSYGGIMALAIAARKPAHLKAIVPLFGCSDVYLDFICPGGCANCLGNYARESFMLAMDLMPPTYQDAEGRWLRVWQQRLQRLENTGPYSMQWEEHPDYDEYWRHRSISVEQISIPTFIIGGWRDIFPEAMPSAYERISAPKKMLMGPWAHTPPDTSTVEAVDWLYEARRWWDYWLQGKQNGIMEEPPVTIFVQGSNTWKHEREWPIARTKSRLLFLSAGAQLSSEEAREQGSETYQAIPTVGTMAPLWDPLGTGVGYPLDQAFDDHNSVTYTSDPLSDDIEITGSPDVTLYVTLERGDELQLVAKLNDVAENGYSTNITSGWLRVAQRDSGDRPEPLEHGRPHESHILLWATSYSVPRGHRLRLSIACSDFPRIWPSPTNPTIRLWFGANAPSAIRFPVIPAPTAPVPGPSIKRPSESVNRTPWTLVATPRWQIHRDLVSDSVAVTLGADQLLQMPTGAKMHFDHAATATVHAARPDGAKVEAEAHVEVRMPAGEAINITTSNRFTREGMLFTAKITVDGRLLLQRRWMNY